MLMLFREGGYPMWLILALGGLSMIVAAYGAVRADKRVLGFVAWMIAATVLASIGGVAADVGATFHYVASQPDGPNSRILIQGLGESTSPAIMGFSFASMAAMLGAIARRRQDDSDILFRLSVTRSHEPRLPLRSPRTDARWTSETMARCPGDFP